MLLKAQSVSKSYGPANVLTDASLQIGEGDRIALVGDNGAGKTTFLRILLGEEAADTGEIVRRTSKIGVMRQFADVDPDDAVGDILAGAFGYVETARRRIAEIDDAMSKGGDIDWNALAEESAALEGGIAKFESEAGGRLRDAMEGVGLPEELTGRAYSELSGGQKAKVMLARLAIQTEDCDLILMDEPTSHLDIATVERMEDAILESGRAVVVVSHDRYFLDRVALRTVEIENGRTREYKGNYSAFVEKRNLDLERRRKEYERTQSQKRKQEAIAEQMFHDQRRYMGSYRTRLMMASKIEEKEKPEERRDVSIRIQAAQKSGKDVVMADDVSIGYGGKPILEHVSMNIVKGDKLGVFGANGAGKSTLVKALMGEVPSEGSLWVAPGAKIGYYSQSHEGLDLRLTAEEQMLQVIGRDRKADARAMLARFLLFEDDVTRRMETLSGGQRARVALCMLLHSPTNLLILDEPTNYVDIPSKHALEQALAEYDGTVVAVTHDRYFLDGVCNKVAEVANGTVTVHNGNYTDLKGAPVARKAPAKGVVYRVQEPFTNWITKTKYAKGDKVSISEDNAKGFEAAMSQGKLRKARRLAGPAARRIRLR